MVVVAVAVVLPIEAAEEVVIEVARPMLLVMDLLSAPVTGRRHATECLCFIIVRKAQEAKPRSGFSGLLR